MRYGSVALIGAGCLISAGIAPAQSVISVRSGLINYVEGRVLLDGKPVRVKFDAFPNVRVGSELRTEAGRAEVLLGPGVFLRLGERSAVRMTSDEIMDTRLEFLGGSVVVESADLAKGQAVTFTYGTTSIGLEKKGLYRIDSAPASLSVYDGEARVISGGQVEAVKHGRRLDLNGLGVAEKFDTKTGDALFRWARRRAEYLAVANISAARQAQSYGFQGSNSWIWNPYFGAYTYLPVGMYSSFWGYRFWSPSNVYMLYMPTGNGWYSGGGSYQPPTSGTGSSVSGGRAGSFGGSALSGGAGGRTSSSPGSMGHGGAAGTGHGK
jgi:hypothetical protein